MSLCLQPTDAEGSCQTAVDGVRHEVAVGLVL